MEPESSLETLGPGTESGWLRPGGGAHLALRAEMAAVTGTDRGQKCERPDGPEALVPPRGPTTDFSILIILSLLALSYLSRVSVICVQQISD